MTTKDIVCFRLYTDNDRVACMAAFDANCPEFFAPNERADFERFLDSRSHGYQVCTVTDTIAGSFGVFDQGNQISSLNWILLNPGFQGMGIGTQIMERAVLSARKTGTTQMTIAASHRSASFFSRFGATAEKKTDNGWGPGLHRIDMVLSL